MLVMMQSATELVQCLEPLATERVRIMGQQGWHPERSVEILPMLQNGK